MRFVIVCSTWLTWRACTHTYKHALSFPKNFDVSHRYNCCKQEQKELFLLTGNQGAKCNFKEIGRYSFHVCQECRIIASESGGLLKTKHHLGSWKPWVVNSRVLQGVGEVPGGQEWLASTPVPGEADELPWSCLNSHFFSRLWKWNRTYGPMLGAGLQCKRIKVLASSPSSIGRIKQRKWACDK